MMGKQDLEESRNHSEPHEGEVEASNSKENSSSQGSGIFSRIFGFLFLRKTNKLSAQFFRYLWVGGTTTLIDVAILNLLISQYGVSNGIAATAGYSAGIVANYFLCIWWIFKSDPTKRKQEFLGSMAIGLVGLVLNNLIIVYGADLLPKLDFLMSMPVYAKFSESIPNYYVNCAKGIATVVVLAWNFLGRKYLIFKGK